MSPPLKSTSTLAAAVARAPGIFLIFAGVFVSPLPGRATRRSGPDRHWSGVKSVTRSSSPLPEMEVSDLLILVHGF